jgi:hypothetical protein
MHDNGHPAEWARVFGGASGEFGTLEIWAPRAEDYLYPSIFTRWTAFVERQPTLVS